MLFNKAYKVRDWDTGDERKTPEGGDLLAMAHVSDIQKGPSDLDRSFWMVASNQTRDRDGDVIRAKGWNLKNFKKNPVGLWMHQYRDLPVFTVPDIKVEDDKLMALMHFPEEMGGLSDDVYRAFQAKALRASSVGFGVEEVKDDEKLRAEFGLPAERGFGNGTLFWKTELWELSAVTVPSNPDALAQIKSVGVPKLEEMLQRSEDFVIEIQTEEPAPLEDTTGDTHDTDGCDCATIPVDDYQTMLNILAEQGYTIQHAPSDSACPESEAQPDNEPQPVDLVFDIEDQIDPAIVELVAERIVRTVRDAVSQDVKRHVQSAITRRINYHLGKLED